MLGRKARTHLSTDCFSLLTAAFFLLPWVPPADAADTTTVRVADVSASSGDTGIVVNITTSNSIFVASTDLVLAYNTSVLTATQVTSPHLTISAANIDDPLGVVRVLTTDTGGRTIPQNGILLAISFSVAPGASAGCYPLTLADLDGEFDFEQPVPPIPPPRVFWGPDNGEFCVQGGPSTTTSTTTPTTSPTTSPTTGVTTTATTSTSLPTTTSTIGSTSSSTAPSSTTTTIDPTTCPVAQLYGEDSLEVAMLRSYRDEVMVKTERGRKLVHLFYQLSPVIAKRLEEDPTFRAKAKRICDEVVTLIGKSREGPGRGEE